MSRYDIAIIGMGCLFPHANTLERYWQNVLDGDSYFEPMPKHLWRLDNFCSPSRAVREKSYTTLGAFIDLKIDFPFLEYRLPPKSMEGMDPAQLVSLYATRQALLDAGIEPRSEALHDAVTIIGASGVDGFAHTTTYLRRHRFFAELRAELTARGVSDSQIASLEAEFGPALKARGHGWDPANAAVGNVPSSISNRIAQVFGIRGYNMTVDGACASSFVALNVACQALCAGDARVVVTGGCDLGTNPGIYVGFSQMEGLSLTGHSNPFDHTADGLVIGEGVGIVVLKRLEDAVADGDRVRAVIRGIGTSSDGAGQAIYAPSVPGRVKSFKAALSNAGTRPREVQYLEGHATSTIVGDAVEYDAIAETYAHDREGVPPLLVGSVKHQIGHLKAAAGMAGLIKTVLAMGHGTFPHMPRFTKLTPEAHNPSDAIAVPTSPSAWVPHADGRRVAAITASGFGGVNYHVIVEQAERYSPPATRPRPARDMAVVAITVRVPGAADVETFWSNVTAGKDVFTPVKGPEIGWHDHLDAGPENERITTHVVGRLEQYDFNYLKHRIFPKSVSQISPTQFLGLDLGERLLDAAGIDIRAPKAIGVSVGTMHDDHYPTLCSPMFADEYAETIRECAAARGIGSAVLDPALAEAGQRFKAQDPPITEHTLPGWMTNVTAGRMANKLNLQGPNFTVDSACSSGVAALVPAVYQLMFGNVDAMITGGFNRQLSAEFTAGVCTLGAVAEWVPRPFDEAGRGFLIGEGGAVYLLKRLADAQRDGDDIVAVLRAVGGSSEADSKSMVAPSELAVRRSIADALRHTVVRGDEIHVVDVHGSANPVSDITEARSLAAELRQAGGDAPPVQITAIKSHIGHLYGGSGATSMLSTILALRTRSVPGIRNLEKLRPELADILAKAEPRKGTRPLAAGAMSGGVNSLGLGGANYFAILTLPEGMQAAADAAPAKAPAAPAPMASVAPVSAATLDGVFLRGASDLAGLVPVLRAAQDQPGLPWLDPAAWADPVRIAVAAGDRVVLGQRLAAAEKMLSRGIDPGPLESQGVFCAQQDPAQPLPGLALCFPGQGVHYVGMGKPLYARDPAFRAVLDRVDALARQAFGFALLEHIHGPEGDAGVERELGTLVGAQTSLFALEVALGRHLLAEGLTPDVFIGHSFGEICALAVAGVWDLDVAFQVVVERIRAAELVARSGGPALGMMSLLCTERQRDALLALAGEAVMLTNVNAPGRYVLAGVRQAIEHCAEGARIFGAEAAVLPIGGAFHSPWMEPAREPFRQALAALPCRRGTHRVLSTVSGAYLEPEALTPGFLAEHLSGQLTTPLNLPREVETLYRDGVRHFLEVGPRWAMTRMVEGILGDRQHRACFCLHPKLGDDESLCRAHAFLAALGHLRGSDSPVAAGLEPEFLAFLAQADPSVYARLVELQRRFIEAPPAPLGSHQGTGAETSLFPTPISGESPAAPAASAEAWVARLKARLVATTGYPEDMLEPELDLEADLGIDSVQRAEIWMALLNEHGLDPAARPSGQRTIANLARCLAALTPGVEPVPVPVSVPVPVPVPEPTLAPAASAASAEAWVARLKARLVATTGYPEDMLEPELDLEADLGIDSVQRAEIWMALLSEHGLDPSARPSGPRTIANLARCLAALTPGGAPEPPAPKAPPAPLGSHQGAGAEASMFPTPSSGDSPPAPAASAEAWVARLKARLVATTGYPEDMLEPELDLEADLGIDSVQRAEIWMALLNEHGLDLAARPSGPRTIANLARCLAALVPGGEPVAAPAPAAPAGPVVAAPEAAVEAPDVTDRWQIEVAAAGAAPPEAEPATLEGGDEGPVLLGFGSERMAPGMDLPFPCKRALCITADLGTCPVVDRLRGAGVEVMALHAGAVASMKTSEVELALRDQDTVVYLAHRDLMGLEGDGTRLAQAVREQTSLLFGVFKALAPVLARRQVRVLVPLTMDGAFGAAGGLPLPLPLLGSFPAGFVRALARELPACRLQLIDTGALPWSDAVEQRIDRLSPGLEVGLGPLGPCAPTLQRLGRVVRRGDLIRPGDLLLVTGGARGIVFECVAALAQVTGARLLLTGRTPMPEGRPDWLDATSETIDGVLRTLELERVRTQGLGLGAARRMTSQARSQWEVAHNLARLDGLGVDARYEVCDVTDRRAFARLLERLSQRETVRGVVHGAGVQRGRLLADLVESEALATVGTKLDPVFTVLDSLKLGDLRVIVAFGSIAGVFGNAGQTDYALANDALGGLVQALGRRHPGLHAQTIHWTAWTGTGMVTPEEEKRFAEAGLVPLDVPRGVRLFLDAVLGAEQAQLAAFNVAAAFTESRAVSPFPLTPRPRARLVEPRPGQPTEVRFSLARDLWLEQHKVNGEPTVPGTFVTELFAQVANELGKGVHEVRFRRPMLVGERGLTVELVRADDTLLAVPRERPDLPAKALANLAFASCRLGPVEHDEPGYLAFKAKEQGALLAAAQEALASFYTTLDERFSHALATGPIFRGIQATRRFGDRFIALASLTDEAMAAMALPGHYLAHPILADMAVQVGAAWAMVEHDVMAIPWEIGSLRIFGESTERDVVVICRATELGQARSVMDVLVREPDGRPVFALMGLTLKAIAGHDRPEAVMAGVVRADGVEDAAAQRHRGSDAPTDETPKKKS